MYYGAARSARADGRASLACLPVPRRAWHCAPMATKTADFRICALLGVDIDGTLTDGFLFWGGPQVGWTQRFAVRDGEALVRLAKTGFPIVPISRNQTACARARMEHLGLPLRWVGVQDKLQALTEVEAHYGIARSQMAYVGDGLEDAALFAQVGLACCVRSGHPVARGHAAYITEANGGEGAVEEVVDQLLRQRPAARAENSQPNDR